MHKVYVIVTDATGRPVAQRYIEDGDRLALWLTLTTGSPSARCDVYDDCPAFGGRWLQALVRDGGRWVERIPAQSSRTTGTTG